jgi:hypothetical protein
MHQSVLASAKLVGLQVVTIAGLLVGGSISAQENKMEIFEIIDGAQITKVASSNVCFATINAKSESETPSFFATYKLKNGDRWQVAGHVGLRVAETEDVITLKFDDEGFIFRETEMLNNTFPLPLTEDADLEQFDALVEKSNTLSLDILRLKDKIIVDLETLRNAKLSMDRCLETIE